MREAMICVGSVVVGGVIAWGMEWWMMRRPWWK